MKWRGMSVSQLLLSLFLVTGVYCTNDNIAQYENDLVSGMPLRKSPHELYTVNFKEMGIDEKLLYAKTFMSMPEKLKALDPYLVGFYIYTKGAHPVTTRVYVNDTQSLKVSGFDPRLKTKFIVHGFLGMLTSEVIQSIKNNLFKSSKELVNVVAVDWSQYALVYLEVFQRTHDVGALVAEFIDFLVDQGASLDDIHCIGHSLGAHVCGFAGSQVKSGKISRITGLDPAGPGFFVSKNERRLNKDDAKFVDCIHTSAGQLGLVDSICSADYYPNKGFHQPGCRLKDIIDFGSCSHGRSYKYFAESILDGHLFTSLTCTSHNFTSTHNVDDCVDKGALMGYPASEKYTGIFYAETNSAYPFAPSSRRLV